MEERPEHDCLNHPDTIVPVSLNTETDEKGSVERYVNRCTVCGRNHYGMNIVVGPTQKEDQ